MTSKLHIIRFVIIISTQLGCNISYSQQLQNSYHSGKLAVSNTQEACSARTISKDASIFYTTISDVISSPLNWKNNDYYYIGGFTAITAGSFLLDHEIRNVFLENRNETFTKLEPIGYTYGAPHYTAASSLMLYFSGTLFNNNWLRDTGLMLTESLVLIGIVQVPLRIIVGRARPYTSFKNSSLKILKGFGQDRASFISGHSAIAFGISNILSHQIDHPIASIGLFGLAALTPLARLNADKHWFSDIVIGSVLGIFISNSIIRIHDERNSTKSNFSFSPTLNGISINYTF